MEKQIHEGFRLGARPAVKKDGMPSLQKMEMFSRLAPAVLRKEHVPIMPILGDNDKIGDCTSVGLFNSAIGLYAMNNVKLATAEGDAQAFYSESTGYNPADPATDRGGVEVDVLAYASEHGVEMASHRFYPIWGRVDDTSLNDLALCTAGLGSTYLGLQLAIADQAGIGGVWDTNAPGNQTPGSWGGHCAVLWSYTGLGMADTVEIITWGKLQKATWRWVLSRIMEAHGVLWPQLIVPGRGFLTQQNYLDLRAQNQVFLNGKV